MRPFGWTLACVLLATIFPKSAILSGVESVGVATGDKYEAGRAKVTKLLPISKDSVMDPDIKELRRFLDDLFHGGNHVQERTRREARTFGHKRIQFMLMPMMYKMGVMMTMLTVLTVISLKGLLIGGILLLLKLSTIIAKFSSGWQHHTPAAQPIHVHVHNSLPTAHSQAYAGWMQHSGPDGDEPYYYRG
ncbi:Protein apnoia [Anthophora quadrimaculata]